MVSSRPLHVASPSLVHHPLQIAEASTSAPVAMCKNRCVGKRCLIEVTITDDGSGIPELDRKQRLLPVITERGGIYSEPELEIAGNLTRQASVMAHGQCDCSAARFQVLVPCQLDNKQNKEARHHVVEQNW